MVELGSTEHYLMTLATRHDVTLRLIEQTGNGWRFRYTASCRTCNQYRYSSTDSIDTMTQLLRHCTAHSVEPLPDWLL